MVCMVRGEDNRQVVDGWDADELDMLLDFYNRYWGFIDLDLIANIDDGELTGVSAADDLERQRKLKNLRDQRNTILKKVKPRTYVSSSRDRVAWLLYLFVMYVGAVLPMTTQLTPVVMYLCICINIYLYIYCSVSFVGF